MTDVSSYTVNLPHEAAWIVYINGLEIPVLGVDVTFGVWQIPTAAVKMVPHPMLQRLGSNDRLHIVIFYKDSHMVAARPQFRLLGEFELVGWTYQNSANGRVLQLDCISPIQIFNQLNCFYMSSVDDIVAAQGTGGEANGAAQSKVFYPTSLFLEGLFKVGGGTDTDDKEAAESDDKEAAESVKVETVASEDFIKRPIDFVLNVFRAVLSPVDTENTDPSSTSKDGYVPMDAVSVPGKNFFARWALRTQFHAKWCALPMFEDDTPVPKYAPRQEGEPSPEEEATASGNLCFPLVKAVQDTSVIDALQQQIGASVGNAGSIWDLLKMVYTHMYMEIAMIPCPPAGAVQKGTGKVGTSRWPGSDEFFGVRSFFVKPQCLFGIPPMCNVVFPSMIQNFTFQETYITQPTRLYLGEAFLSHILDPDSRLGGLVPQIMATGFPPVVKNRMQQTITATNVNSKNFLVQPEELYKGPVSKRMSAPPWMSLLQQNAKGDSSSSPPPSAEEEAALAAIGAGSTSTGLGALFDKYAQYEYYRSRYAERQGGVAMPFNPYILPGFPAVVYDQRASGFDVLGYVMSVTHSMSANRGDAHMSTQASMSFIRTLEEMHEVYSVEGVDTIDSIRETDIYPVETIPSIRDIFQQQASADEFYRILLYGRDYPGKQPKAWDQSILTQFNQIKGEWVRSPDPAWEPMFTGFDEAMSAISRPVCTLKEYVESLHQRRIQDLLADGTVRGEYRSFYTAVGEPNPEPSGAVFYGRIYKNTPAPVGYRAPDVLVNVSQDSDTENPAGEVAGDISKLGPVGGYDNSGSSGGWQVAADGEIPDTIKDWDAILEAYRKILRSEDGKIAPQV